MVTQEQESKQNPIDPKSLVEDGQNMPSLFSPRFKSLAAMAGWDEESILTAALIVEDTPDRDFNRKKRSDLNFKTPPSNTSRRKRRAHRKSPISISVPVISLEEEEEPEKQEINKAKTQSKEENTKAEEEEEEEEELKKTNTGVSCSNPGLPCMDKLREELSCAICLEICFEPSTTTCGHSFCKKCLKSAADKCGKRCPKCRHLISNGRLCTVNTVLWNTIQLLFPQEVETRKTAAAMTSRERQTPATRTSNEVRNRNFQRYVGSATSRDVSTGRTSSFIQEEDSESAQRLPRDDLTRLLRSYESGINRRRAAPSQDSGAELARTLRRENLSSVLSRDASTRRRWNPNQDEDAALALRLQREEFMEAFRGTNDRQSGSSLSSARENLRAMAARAFSIRMRNRAT